MLTPAASGSFPGFLAPRELRSPSQGSLCTASLGSGGRGASSGAVTCPQALSSSLSRQLEFRERVAKPELSSHPRREERPPGYAGSRSPCLPLPAIANQLSAYLLSRLHTFPLRPAPVRESAELGRSKPGKSPRENLSCSWKTEPWRL